MIAAASLFAVGEKDDDRRPVAEIERLGGNGNRARERRLTVRLQHIDLAHDAPGGIRARRQFEVDVLALAVGPGPRRRVRDCARAQPSAARWRERGGLAEFASRCFRRSPCRSSSQRHRRRSWRRIRISEDRRLASRQAWKPARRGGGRLRRPGQGRSARSCASSTATSAARHEPVPIIELDAFRKSRPRRVAVKPCKGSAPPDGAGRIRALLGQRAEGACCQISLAVAELRHVVREEISA